MFKFLFKLLLLIIVILGVFLALIYKKDTNSVIVNEIDIKNYFCDNLNSELDLVSNNQKNDVEIVIDENILTDILNNAFNQIRFNDEYFSFNKIYAKIDNEIIRLFVESKTNKYISFYTVLNLNMKLDIDNNLNLKLEYETSKLGHISLNKSFLKKILSYTKIENEYFNLNELILNLNLYDYLKDYINAEYMNIIKDLNLLSFNVNNNICIKLNVSNIEDETCNLKPYLNNAFEYQSNFKNQVVKYLISNLKDKTYFEFDEIEFNQLLYFELFDKLEYNKNIDINGINHKFMLYSIDFDFYSDYQIINLIFKFDNIKILIRMNSNLKTFKIDDINYLGFEFNKIIIKDKNIDINTFNKLFNNFESDIFKIDNNMLYFSYETLEDLISNDVSILNIMYKDAKIILDLKYADSLILDDLTSIIKDELINFEININDDSFNESLNNLKQSIDSNININESIDEFILELDKLENNKKEEVINELFNNLDEDKLNSLFSNLGGK